MKRNFLPPILLLFIWLSFDSYSQQQISLRDAKEITYQAKSVVQGYEGLLNYVTFSENPVSELKEVIANSYSPSRIQVFQSKDVIIEDDIDPASDLGNARDLPVDQYLNTLDVFYAKSIDATVSFSNFRFSNIKKNDYLYVKVFFERNFGGKHKEKGMGYAPKPRQALVRLDKQENKWKATIIGVNFYDPTDVADTLSTDMVVVADSSESTNPLTQEEYEKERENFIAQKEEEDRKREAAYKEALTLASSLFASKEYEHAKEAYLEAQKYKEFTPEANIRLQIIERILTNKDTYENHKGLAEQAKNGRRFDEAIIHYKKAIELKPESLSELDPIIRNLSAKVNVIASPRNKLESGKIKEAIDECDDLIKEKIESRKATDKDFPELYLVRGQAYWQSIGSDRKALDRALADFNAAVALDGNYLEARLIRADFQEKMKNDLVAAITDYDVITSLVSVDQRPEYFVKKAVLKEKVGNVNAAIEDYTKAIELKKLPEYFYNKGLLQAKIQEWKASIKAFDEAIELDKNYASAFFQAGLSFFALEQYTEAAKRFRKAQELTLDSLSVQSIHTKSYELYNKGEQALQSGDYDKALKFYTNAVLIWPGNSQALYKKGETFYQSKEYVNAIELYNAAIKLNGTYSQAHYKKGMAQYMLKQYQEAITSFTNAVGINEAYREAFLGRGHANKMLEKHKEAIEDYQKTVNILLTDLKKEQKLASSSGNKSAVSLLEEALAEPYMYLGQCQYAVKDYTNAILNLDAALKQNSQLAEAFYFRGLAYEAKNELKEAIKDLNEATRLTNTNIDYHYAKGQVYYKNGSLPEAVKSYSYAIGLDSAAIRKDTHYRRGVCYFKLTDYASSLVDFVSYEKSTTQPDPDFYTDFGFVHLYLNNDSLASAYFNKSLSLQPSPKAALGLGCTFSKVNNLDEALLWLEKAMAFKTLTKTEVSEVETKFLANINANKIARKKLSKFKKAYVSQK